MNPLVSFSSEISQYLQDELAGILDTDILGPCMMNLNDFGDSLTFSSRAVIIEWVALTFVSGIH